MLRQIERLVRRSLEQENVGRISIQSFISSCSAQSNLKDALAKITNGIIRAAKCITNAGDIQGTASKSANMLIADNSAVSVLKMKYMRCVYTHYRSLNRPLAAFVKKMISNSNIVVWNSKGIRLI